MPSIPELVYAALLYKDDYPPATPLSTDFVQGTKVADSDKFVFSFQRPDETSNLTLEIFAFKSDTIDFSKEKALLSGKEPGLKVKDNAIEVEATIALSVYEKSEEKGIVSLQIKVPADCTLTIDDTTHFDITDNAPNFTITQNGTGIPAGTYSVTFTVKKVNGDKTEIIHIFPESINVLPGMCTDTWGGLGKDEAKDIANVISKTVYVRGTGGWYETSTYNVTAEASDDNSGTFLYPLATIQKAVDTIIARNDGTSEYTICIDGTLDGTTAAYLGTYGMADFSALAQDLNLTIKALSGTATLDGGARFAADGNVEATGIRKHIICAHLANGKLELTLENLVIMGGYKTSDSGGGIRFSSLGGKLTISNGTTICGNKATNYGGGVYVYNGTFTMTGGTISDCTATSRGGGVYVDSNGTFNMSETAKITGCKTTSTDANTGGGGIYNLGTLAITGGTISGCTSARNGGGILLGDGTLDMTDCKVYGNNATERGGGVYAGNGTFTMTGGTIGGENAEDGNIAKEGGGVYVGGNGTFKMEGGTISNNKGTSSSFGGVYINGGKFCMSGTAKVESNNSVYTIGTSSPVIYISGALADTTTPVATIKLVTYEVNKKILVADGVPITQDVCDKFALIDEGGKIVPSGDGTAGVLKVHTIFLNSESGRDDMWGVNASTMPLKTLKKAIEWYDKHNAEKIIVCAPYTLPSEESTLLDRTGKSKLTLMRYAGSSDGSDALTGDLLTISQGDVTISNVTLDGNKNNVNAEGRLLYISGSDTTVTLGTDATLCNNKTSKPGGAVYISEGTFEMEDGTITGNKATTGGGVYVYSGGTFNMNGGKISGNGSSYGGGVGIFGIGSTFNMSKGEISDNNADYGGGMYANWSILKMTGGKIINNIASQEGGGVFFSGDVTFDMSDGEITGNTANTGNNGIYETNNNTINQTGGTVQSD